MAAEGDPHRDGRRESCRRDVLWFADEVIEVVADVELLEKQLAEGAREPISDRPNVAPVPGDSACALVLPHSSGPLGVEHPETPDRLNPIAQVRPGC
jgi:hypothetical protein